MTILGLSAFFHDSSACLLIDGKIVAAAAEERFTRIKHDNAFPDHAIEYCINEASIAMNEIDYVVFYEKPLIKFDRMLHQHLQHFPKSYSTFMSSTGAWLTQKLNVTSLLREKCNYYGEVLFVPHHLSHAASSYYLSPFKSAAILTIDGVGEWTTTAVGFGTGDHISLEKEVRFPHSLGLLYSAVTAYLGFKVNNDEYKVMGLAAYGNPKKYRDKVSKLLQQYDDGSFRLDMRYFDFDWADQMPSAEMGKLFGHPIRKPESKIYSYHQDIAATLQEKLEKTIFKLLHQLHENHPVDNLCLAGGVALNSLMNGKIVDNTPFKRLFIPPDPSDAGGAMGAALHIHLKLSNANKKTNKHASLSKSFSPYLGPDYHWYQVETALESYLKEHPKAFLYQRLTKVEMVKKVASLLSQQKVIGWFQGRMEWGPRALGNRSILAAANHARMKKILNQKVKKRELFRPFAPAILEEHAQDFFSFDPKSTRITDWMLTVHPFTPRGKKQVPATVHVDNTGRLQTVSKNSSPLFYQLIDQYYQLTDIPAIINTSFNVRGEPIVTTPKDAIKCFLGTDIDYLVLGTYIASKGKGGKHV